VTQPLARFRPSPSEVDEINSLLQRENPRIGSAPLILLNPNASDLLPLRRLSPLRYVQLARRLLEHYPELFIAFTGAPTEAAAINQLASDVASSRVISLAGKTTLRQVLVLYTQSEILVTNDSGPAHFASMTPIQVVAVFGIILLTVAIRLPSLLHPQPIDSEAMYSVVANEIVDGGRPYADAVERKPPLLFWTYAAIFKVAGKFNWKALHIVALVWTLCAIAGLYVICRELFDRNTGLIAAFFYGVFQP